MSKTYKLYTINDVDYIEHTALTDLQRESEKLQQQIADYEKALVDAQNQLEMFNFPKDEIRVRRADDIIVGVLTKYKDK